jgi:23S rRNA (uracil1939-C5)-methyltransferase
VALSIGETIRLTVEKAAAGGEMLGRVDGQVVLVTGAIPGEQVIVRVDRIAKRVAHANVIDVGDASPDRREAFSDPLCGGCLYSHIAYSRQLALKSDVIVDAFSRIAKIPLPAPPVVNPSPEDGYRMRARLHMRGPRLGFFREGTHEICDVRQTRQLLPATCDALDRLTAAARSLGAAELIREIELSENIDGSERVVHIDSVQPLAWRVLDALTNTDGFSSGPHVTDTLSFGDRRFTLRRHVLAFFQGNRYLLHGLVEHVVSRLASGASVMDLYAGAGLFAIAAALLRGATVTAVEGDRYAAADLHANAAAAGGTIETKRASIESFAATMKTADTVIVDPPRTGMTPAALDGVLRVKPRSLIYVSCDVATLARDARAIVARGYGLGALEAFDLFPNTPHVETIVEFGI